MRKRTLAHLINRNKSAGTSELSCYTGTGHDGARGSGTRLVMMMMVMMETSATAAVMTISPRS